MVALFPLETRGLKVSRRGATLLGPLDLSLGPSGVTMVIGPNGAGKTTLLKTLYGLQRPTKGSVTWAAADAEVRAHQAYVFQTPTMLRRSVADNLAYPLQLIGMNPFEADGLVEEWAARIGLADALDRYAPHLSGGERQKLALARALIRGPRALFLDEPCANLDGRATSEIETLLHDAHANGTRIVMTSHNVGQIRRLATDIVFLNHGVLDAAGGADILATPTTPALAAFLNGDLVP